MSRIVYTGCCRKVLDSAVEKSFERRLVFVSVSTMVTGFAYMEKFLTHPGHDGPPIALRVNLVVPGPTVRCVRRLQGNSGLCAYVFYAYECVIEGL